MMCRWTLRLISWDGGGMVDGEGRVLEVVIPRDAFDLIELCRQVVEDHRGIAWEVLCTDVEVAGPPRKTELPDWGDWLPHLIDREELQEVWDRLCERRGWVR